MKITINERYFVEVDPLNHTLYEVIPGNKAAKIVGYFSNLQAIFKRIIYLDVITKEETVTAEEFIERLENYEADVDKLLKTIEFK